MSARKFTDEQAIEAINNKNNLSVKAVLRQLSSSCGSGSNYDLIYKIVGKYNLDTSHWLGKRICWGQRSYNWKSVKDYLTNDKGSKINTHKLKTKLFQEGIKKKCCEKCGIDAWNNLPAPLELHHINGNKRDNRLENLNILCPNCHAQTSNHAGKALRHRGRKRNEQK